MDISYLLAAPIKQRFLEGIQKQFGKTGAEAERSYNSYVSALSTDTISWSNAETYLKMDLDGSGTVGDGFNSEAAFKLTNSPAPTPTPGE